jgi:hypothetical protein
MVSCPPYFEVDTGLAKTYLADRNRVDSLQVEAKFESVRVLPNVIFPFTLSIWFTFRIRCPLLRYGRMVHL